MAAEPCLRPTNYAVRYHLGTQALALCHFRVLHRSHMGRAHDQVLPRLETERSVAGVHTAGAHSSLSRGAESLLCLKRPLLAIGRRPRARLATERQSRDLPWPGSGGFCQSPTPSRAQRATSTLKVSI